MCRHIVNTCVKNDEAAGCCNIYGQKLVVAAVAAAAAAIRIL